MMGLFVAVHESGCGPRRRFAALRNLVRYRGISDSGAPSARRIIYVHGLTRAPKGDTATSVPARTWHPADLPEIDTGPSGLSPRCGLYANS